jgi:hypothetical protein
MLNPAFWAGGGSGDSMPANITANGGFSANNRSYGEDKYIIYSKNYHLTTISLYGFQRKRPGPARKFAATSRGMAPVVSGRNR